MEAVRGAGGELRVPPDDDDVAAHTRLVAFAGSKLRIHLDIRIGEHFLDEAVVQAKDKVNEVNVRVEHLLEQIHHISKEQNYEREREEKFRKTSEQTNSNIL